MDDEQAAGVDPVKLYPASTLQRASGLGPQAIRNARKAGMPCKSVSGRLFVLGADFIEHVLRNGKEAKDK